MNQFVHHKIVVKHNKIDLNCLKIEIMNWSVLDYH